MTHDRSTSLRRTSRVRRSILVGAVTASLGVTAACGIAAQNTAGTSTGTGSGGGGGNGSAGTGNHRSTGTTTLLQGSSSTSHATSSGS